MVQRLSRAALCGWVLGSFYSIFAVAQELPSVPVSFDPSEAPKNPSPCFEFYCFDGSAFDGNTLVAVGGMTYPAGYVFARNASGQWAQQQVLEPGATPVPFTGPLYQKPVAVSGKEIFITRETCATDVYRRTGNRWRLKQTLAACGSELVADRGRLLVNGGGSVSVFTRQSGGKYALETTLTPGDQPNFGPEASVSIQGWTIAVGAPNTREDTGAVYIFQRWGKHWVRARKIVPGPEVGEGSKFGATVSVSGENVAIGAPEVFLPDTNSYGLAYIYSGIGSLWYQRQRIEHPDPASSGGLRFFATRLELQGRRLIVSLFDHYPFAQGPFTYYYERPLWELEWAPKAVLEAGRALTIAISGGTAMVDGQGFRGGSYPAIYDLPQLSMTPPSWLPNYMRSDDGLDGEASPP